MASDARNGGEAVDGEARPEERRLAETLAAGLAARDRRAFARAVTLVESTRTDHRRAARALLAALPPPPETTLRLGLSGAPGVGKSTFIERFGFDFVETGARLVVLAVDPSSRLGGGAILGDKTRMERLARHAGAFVRPSSAAGALGGVARRTRETIRLAEAFGADMVLVETVGVGQSETAVADMTDVFVLLVGPAAGDELQGVKRGVMELADFVVVTKADGALESAAALTAADYAGALRLLRRRKGDPDDAPAAMAVSAVTGAGLAELRDRIAALDAWRRAEGWRPVRRARQDAAQLHAEIDRGLRDAFEADAGAAALLRALEAQVAAGALSPEAAAETAVARFLAAAAR